MARKSTNLAKHAQSGMWSFRYEVAGKQKWRSLGTRDERVAQKLVRPLVAKMRAERIGLRLVETSAPAPVVGPSWEQVVAAYRHDVTYTKLVTDTQTRYEIDLRRIGDDLAGLGIGPAKVDRTVVARFVNDWMSDDDDEYGLSASSARNALTAWSRCHSAALHSGLLDRNAITDYDRKRIGRAEAELDPPLGDDFERMMVEVREGLPSYALLVEFLHRVGSRLTETLHVVREDILQDLEGAWRVHLRHTKGGRRKNRFVRLNSAEELLPLLPKRGRIFPNLPPDKARVSSRWGQWLNQREASERAAAEREDREIVPWKLRRWRLHDLRHAFAISASLQDAAIHALAEHLGHSSTRVTARYLRWMERLPVDQRGGLRLDHWRGSKTVKLPQDPVEVDHGGGHIWRNEGGKVQRYDRERGRWRTVVPRLPGDNDPCDP